MAPISPIPPISVESQQYLPLPSLKSLFSTATREDIMFDAVGDGQDWGAEVASIRTDFDIDFSDPQWTCWVLSYGGDGSWIGIWTAQDIPSEYVLLSSPVIVMPSDSEPELNQLNIVQYILQQVQRFLDEKFPWSKLDYNDPTTIKECEAIIAELQSLASKVDFISRGPVFQPPLAKN